MPRRPKFQTELQTQLFAQLSALRLGDGLSATRLPEVAPTLLVLPKLRTTWTNFPEKAPQLASDLIIIWLSSDEDEKRKYARAALNIEPMMPEYYRPDIGSRRRWASETYYVSPDTARSHEDEVLVSLVQDLTTGFEADLLPGPQVQVQVGDDWQDWEIEVATAPSASFGLIAAAEYEKSSWMIDSARNFVQHRQHRKLCPSIPTNTVSILEDYSERQARVLRVKANEGGRIHGVFAVGRYLEFVVELAQPALPSNWALLDITATLIVDTPSLDLDGCEWCVRSYPITQFDMEISFPSNDLPPECWWFRDLPLDLAPGPPIGNQQIVVSRAAPIASWTPANVRPNGLAMGIAWRW